MKKYSLVLADPSWHYSNFREKCNGSPVPHYPVMKDKDIVALPVDRIAADDSMLWLWATWPKLETALTAMNAWGFRYISSPLVWVKTNADGSPYHGIGFWALGSSEFVLMGKRGKGLPRNPDTRGKIKQVLTAPRTKHSQKPLQSYDQLLGLVGNIQPRIELFARTKQPGWDATGLEYDGRDIQDFLEG